MAVTIRVPTPLRRNVGGAPKVQATGSSVLGLIDDVERQFPGFKERICEDDGTVKRHMNLFLNGEDIRFAQGIETAVKDGDEMSIIPANSGG